MSEKIEPAMTQAQWEHMKREHSAGIALLPGAGNAQQCASMIAAYNDALPDSDPRKITRDDIEALRRICRSAVYQFQKSTGAVLPDGKVVERIADALESYLPPETP